MVLIAPLLRRAAPLLLFGLGAHAAEIRAPAAGPHQVSVIGLSGAEREALAGLDQRALAAALSVFTGADVPPSDIPAIAGDHVLDDEGLHFRPRFPFVPDLSYTVRFASGPGSPVLKETFVRNAPAGPPPRVVAVFPSGDHLPANTLRLYVHFSRPMESLAVHRFVRLLDDRGETVPLAFVEIEHGLWDARQTRLTLLFHPGRIKRGVAPGKHLGPPLVAGREYRLVVSGAMTDTTGRSLGRDFERRFQAGLPDRESPSATAVRVHAPLSPSDPLVVDLPEPLDEGLLHRFVVVEDAGGSALPGSVSVAEGESRWNFVPAAAWASGSYAVRIDPALEDRAGNRFDRIFDRATTGQPEDEPRAPSPPVRLPFRVGAEKPEVPRAP